VLHDVTEFRVAQSEPLSDTSRAYIEREEF